jgi:hypothetical protein
VDALPGVHRPRFYEHKFAVESLGVVPPLVTGIVAAVANAAHPETRILGWVLAVGACWLGIASAVRLLHARSEDRQRKGVRDHDGLYAALHVLWAIVSNRAGCGAPDGTLRLTLHRVVPAPADRGGAQELEQLLPYLGGPGAGAGRTFSIRSGVIGRAVRERASMLAARRSEHYEQFIVELVREWAYTEHDARRLSSDRQAWLAVPIIASAGVVVAVVYLDSNRSDVFTPDVCDLVIRSALGMASYIEGRY